MLQFHGLSDLDQMLFKVRDTEAKKLIGEAVVAYRGGALRAALVATWIAVVYDIISKARELAAQGEGVAKVFVAELDTAIESRNKPKLQQLESNILEKANTDFGFFSPHEYEDLSRLNADRNLCAHPAFVSQDALFQPTPELVRVHLVHAVGHLLSHAPLQGKAAVLRLESEMTRPSFPSSATDIEEFMKARYLDRAKDSLVVSLVGALLGCSLGADYQKYVAIARQVAITLGVIGKLKPAIYEMEMPRRIEKKAQAATDEQLLNLVRLINVDARIWNWISVADQLRLRKLISTSSDEQVKRFDLFEGLQHPDLHPILLLRFAQLSSDWQQLIIAEKPNRGFSPLALEKFAAVRGFRQAEIIARQVILPMLPYFEAEDIRDILQAALQNLQISDAGDMPDLFNEIFDKTKNLLPNTGEAWKNFIEERKHKSSAGPKYAYPGIRDRLKQAGVLP